MNAEINGRFLLLSEDDDDDKVMQPDVARVLVLDNLWKEEDENFGEDDDCVKAFTKALASVRIVVPVGKEEEEEEETKKNRRRRRANERRSVLGTGNGGSKR